MEWSQLKFYKVSNKKGSLKKRKQAIIEAGLPKQQFCDIFGKKGDAWHMILGDNPTGDGFKGTQF